MTATSLRSVPELLLATQLEQAGLPEPTREFRFSERKWRFDFVWMHAPGGKLAVEVEGGHWIGGHGGARFEQDAEKYNEAALQGWRVLRVTPRMIESGKAIELVRRALNP